MIGRARDLDGARAILALLTLVVVLVASRPASSQELHRFPIAWTQTPSAENGYPETWEFEFSHDANTWETATLARPIGPSSWCWDTELESEHAGGYVRARATGPAGFGPWNRWLTVPEPSPRVAIALGAIALAGAARTVRRRP